MTPSRRACHCRLFSRIDNPGDGRPRQVIAALNKQDFVTSDDNSRDTREPQRGTVDMVTQRKYVIRNGHCLPRYNRESGVQLNRHHRRCQRVRLIASLVCSYGGVSELDDVFAAVIHGAVENRRSRQVGR